MRSLVVASAVLLVGCRKPPTVENHYYSLVLEAAETRTPPPPKASVARVDLVEVTVPDFLKSRSLVLQVSTNEVRHARSHHWGEPLDVSVGKVLAWDLGAALDGVDVAPGHGRGADCVLHLELDRFHATADARVLVSGRYTLVHGDRTHRRDFDVTQVQHGDGYTQTVKAMRRAVRALSEELQPVVAACAGPGPETSR